MNKYNSYTIMSKIAEDIKEMLKEKYHMDLWYMDRPLQDQEIDGVIVSEGGSRDSWGITIETQDDDNIDYTMDIGIRMKEVK
tara:strand:- start:221 stop:466 length:246 start_codon:yes stop_codon:yes gene_type:complete